MRIKTLIGLRIRELRLSKRLTQNGLSSNLSIPQSTIACWELGIHIPPLRNLVLLADFFDVSLDSLIGRAYNSESATIGR